MEKQIHFQKIKLISVVLSSYSLNVQARPNPDFGGSQTEATHMLSGIEGYCGLPLGPAPVQEIMALCSANTARDVIDAAFDKLPPSMYQFFPQLSQAWFHVRSRVPVTGSRLYGLTLLSLLPTRRRGMYEPDRRVHRPPHRMGMSCCLPTSVIS